jgi:hypothetical protein
MFANPAMADLHLLSSATNAIDRGLSLSSVTNDIDGDRRPRGASSDIGADEFSTNVPPRVSNLKLLGPNALISLTTLPGESYDVLRASNPADGPWAVVASNLAGASHDIEVTDAQGASQGKQFYRPIVSVSRLLDCHKTKLFFLAFLLSGCSCEDKAALQPQSRDSDTRGSGTPTEYSEKPDWMPVAPPNRFRRRQRWSVRVEDTSGCSKPTEDRPK